LMTVITLQCPRSVIKQPSPQRNVQENNRVCSFRDFRLDARIESVRNPRFGSYCREGFLPHKSAHLFNVKRVMSASSTACLKPKAVDLNMRNREPLGNHTSNSG